MRARSERSFSIRRRTAAALPCSPPSPRMVAWFKSMSRMASTPGRPRHGERRPGMVSTGHGTVSTGRGTVSAGHGIGDDPGVISVAFKWNPDRALYIADPGRDRLVLLTWRTTGGISRSPGPARSRCRHSIVRSTSPPRSPKSPIRNFRATRRSPADPICLARLHQALSVAARCGAGRLPYHDAAVPGSGIHAARGGGHRADMHSAQAVLARRRGRAACRGRQRRLGRRGDPLHGRAGACAQPECRHRHRVDRGTVALLAYPVMFLGSWLPHLDRSAIASRNSAPSAS